MRDLVLAAETQFYLPEITYAMKLLRQFENGTLANVMKRYQVPISELQRSLEAMSTVWLDTENVRRSFEGFAALQGMGHGLSTMQPFGTRLTDALRIDLGDWRKKVIWPTDIFIDPLARSSFYVECGLNPTLTAFPTNTFEQIVAETGLKGTQAHVADEYDFDSEREDAATETAFERTNHAHDAIQRFETQIRRFIDERMKEAFGTNWVKHQVPGEMRTQWLDKQQKAKENRERQWPLIAYADFSDYVKIITRNDNWRTVFEELFVRKTSVQESFQRLHPIRTCTMHSRLITRDDELYLYVETKRILDAIGIKK